MSGKQLCFLLENLGIKEASHTPESLAWTCQQEGPRNLVKWLCNNVSKERNVLSLSELAEYNELREQGKTLQGDGLEASFRNFMEGNAEVETELDYAICDVLEETQDLKQQATLLNLQLDSLQSQLKAVDEQELRDTSIAKGVAHFKDEAKDKLEKVRENIRAQRVEFDDLVEEVKRTICEIERFYTGEESGGKPELLITNLQPFIRQSEALQKELELWYQRQFSSDEGLDIFGPSGQKEGGKADLHQKRVAELARISKVSGKAEEQSILACAELARLEAELAVAKSQSASSQTPTSQQLAEAWEALRRLESEEKEMKEEIAELCLELGELNNTLVYEGDYEQKRQRQRQNVEKYQTFIGYLLRQLALHVVLAQLCCEERQTHSHVCALLLALKAELKEDPPLFSKPISKGELPGDEKTAAGNAALEEEAVIAKRMAALLRLFPDLPQPDNDSVDAVGKWAAALKKEAEDLQRQVATFQKKDAREVSKQLEQTMEAAHKLLFSELSEQEPSFLPKSLIRQMDDLDALSSKLESEVQDIVARKKRLDYLLETGGDDLASERRAFVDFYCNPDRLKT